MITQSSFQYVQTDKDLHFTEKLTQNASEYEDFVVTGTGPMPCYIESIRLWSTQNLAYLVGFHRTDNTTPGADDTDDYDKNTLVDFWSFVAGDGFAVASGYLYSVTGMSIPYRDEDNSGELHVSFHNRSSTDKRSVASGYVQMTFGLKGAA